MGSIRHPHVFLLLPPSLGISVGSSPTLTPRTHAVHLAHAPSPPQAHPSAFATASSPAHATFDLVRLAHADSSTADAPTDARLSATSSPNAATIARPAWAAPPRSGHGCRWLARRPRVARATSTWARRPELAPQTSLCRLPRSALGHQVRRGEKGTSMCPCF